MAKFSTLHYESESWSQMKGKLVVRLLSAAVDSGTGYVVSSFHPLNVQSLNNPTCSFDADSYLLHHAASESKCQAFNSGD